MYKSIATSVIKYVEDLRRFLIELDAGIVTVNEAPKKPLTVYGPQTIVRRSTYNRYALMNMTWDRLSPVYAIAVANNDRALKNYVLDQCLWRHDFDSLPELRAEVHV